MNRFRAADDLVALCRAKEAGVISTLGRAVKGTGQVVQSGASAAGEELAKQIGGASGRYLGQAVKAAPTIGLIGGGIYGLDKATDYSQAKLQQLKHRLAQSMVRQDPRTGAYY